MVVLPEQRVLIYSSDNMLKGFRMPGRYWASPFEKLESHSVNDPFLPKLSSLDTILAFPGVKEQLDIIEVPDAHIALHYVNSNFTGVILPGRTCFWKSPSQRKFVMVDLDETEATEKVERSALVHPAVRDYLLIYTVEPSQQGLLFIDKVFNRILESGNYFFWKGTKSVSVEKVDLRQQQLEITGQEIMSRDKVPLRLNFFCQYKIIDVKKAGMEIKEFEKQFHVVLQLALREYIGSLLLDEIMEKKEEIGKYVSDFLKEQAEVFGLEIGNSGIKDVILPGEIREIFNQVLIAEKKSQANVIMRREETASTRSLLNTAKLMEDNEVLFRLKELEYIERISEKVSQISLSSGGMIVDQLRQLFVSDTKGKEPSGR